jgi:hypothetical protein
VILRTSPSVTDAEAEALMMHYHYYHYYHYCYYCHGISAVAVAAAADNVALSTAADTCAQGWQSI